MSNRARQGTVRAKVALDEGHQRRKVVRNDLNTVRSQDRDRREGSHSQDGMLG